MDRLAAVTTGRTLGNDRTPLALSNRRVLIIVENLPVPFDRRVWQEAKTLKANGAQVSVICPEGPGAEARFEVLDGINIYRHPLPSEGKGALRSAREYATALFWELWLALRVWKSHGFDVIHACNPPDLIFLVAWPFKLLGKRFLFDHHDINPELYEAKFGRRDFFWRLMLLLERLTFFAADISIATNDSYKRIALQRGKMAADKVYVVRSGPDLTRVRPAPRNAQWRNGRKFLVGYVGVMGQQEGVDLLLGAVKHIVDCGRVDVQFCLVGGGPSLEDMETLCRSLGLENYVTFTGRVPDAVLLEVLSTADVCVNPDRVNPMNNLSTMNKILEYMSLSKPIVQFEVVEGRISAGEASLYAKPNDVIDLAEKITMLLDDPPRRREMGDLGRARIEQELSWGWQEGKLLDAYRHLFSLP